MAERLNLPPSNVKRSISTGMAGTAWAPALENIPALTEEGWTWPASSVWFGFCCSVLGPKFSSRSACCQAPNIGDSSMVAGGELLCPHGFLKEGEVTGPPQVQGKVITLYTCWGAQQRPFTPEVLNKSPWIQRASYWGVRIKTWIASLGNLLFENLAFESLNMFMPRSFPCEIV